MGKIVGFKEGVNDESSPCIARVGDRDVNDEGTNVPNECVELNRDGQFVGTKVKAGKIDGDSIGVTGLCTKSKVTHV